MECAALKLAVDLVHIPSQVRHVRSAPLPGGIPILLQIAAGDEGAIMAAIQATGRPREVVRDAVAFFIEQVLFSPDADSYRILGANPGATGDELRRNMALLLRWLHPDLDPGGGRSPFASKVTVAWNDLKTKERRDAYDQSRGAPLSRTARLRKKNPARRRFKQHGLHERADNGRSQYRTAASDRSVHGHGQRRGPLQQLLLFLFSGYKT
jgi:hypothetical protein